MLITATQVLDNIEQLQQNFPTEVQQILSLCSDSGGRAPIEVVVTSSSWSPEVPAIHTLISSQTHLSSDPARLIIACPIEASIRAGVKMVCTDNSDFVYCLPLYIVGMDKS